MPWIWKLSKTVQINEFRIGQNLNLMDFFYSHTSKTNNVVNYFRYQRCIKSACFGVTSIGMKKVTETEAKAYWSSWTIYRKTMIEYLFFSKKARNINRKSRLYMLWYFNVLSLHHFTIIHYSVTWLIPLLTFYNHILKYVNYHFTQVQLSFSIIIN